MSACPAVTPISASSLASNDDHLMELSRNLLKGNAEAVIVPTGMPATFFLARRAADLPSQSVFPLSSESLL